MARYWNAKSELIVGDKIFSSDDFEIEFRVPFDDNDEPNVSEIKIYNLTNDSIFAMKKGTRVILNAGHEGDVGTILRGSIEKSSTTWDSDNIDKITKLIVGESSDKWRKEYVSKSYKPGIRASEILKDLAGQFGIELGELHLANDIVYKRGRSISSMLQSAMRQIAHDAGSKFHISNGKIYIRPWHWGNIVAFDLNFNTGLIGSPEYFEEEVDNGKRTGYNVRMLLNHRVNVDSIIKIKSRTVNGTFRVQKGEHTSDFETKVEVVR